MKAIQLLITLQVCLCWNFSEYQGPVSTPFSQKCTDSSMTDDGSFFYCTANLDNELKIFKNNGYGFDLIQIFSVASAGMMCNSDDGGHVVVGGDEKIHIFLKTPDKIYT